jgi:hypothetical protein
MSEKPADLVPVAPQPLPPGGRSVLEPAVAEGGAVPAIPGAPPVSTSVPVPAEALGTQLPGVQLGQRPRHRGDTFGWPANAAPGKPEGEVDTRP